MSVRSKVLTLIKRRNMSHFTLSELKDLCKGIVRSKSQSHYHSLIYKTLWMMEKKGYLSVLPETDGKNEKIYSLTEQGRNLLERIDEIEEPLTQNLQATNSMEHIVHLVNDYSVALAEASAEAQEYQDLSQKLPSMKEFLQAKYIEAKSRAAHFKGRLVAVENLLLKENSDVAS